MELKDRGEFNKMATALDRVREALSLFRAGDGGLTGVHRAEIRVFGAGTRGEGISVELPEADAHRYLANEEARIAARLRELGVDGL